MSQAPDTVEGEAAATDAADEPPAIKCHRATESRRVFTEDGNTDGWIATDLTVPLRE